MNLKAIEKKILAGKTITEEEEEYLAKRINDYWENHPDVVNRYPRWKKYIAWVAGYQLFDYNKISKKLIEVPLARQRKLIFNRLRSFVRTLLAKLTADFPQSGVVPNTTDDSDIQSARVGDKVIESLNERLNVNKVLSDIKLWIIICNRAYLRVLWDKEANGVLGYGKVEDEDISEGSTPLGKKVIPASELGTDVIPEEIPEMGDVAMECISPFNCRCDPLYQDRDRWRWFIYGEEVDAGELETEYDLKKGTIKEIGTNVLDTAYDLELQDEQDIIIGSPDKAPDMRGKTVVFKEFWTKNIWVFVAGQKVLDYGINDYGEIPYYDFEDRLIPISDYERGFSYNESIMKDVIPIQREYNRQASLVSIALDRASKLKVLTPLGSLLNKKQWTNDYGVFIDYNRNAGEPHQMKIDPFPFEVNQYRSSLEREIESIMNVHEASFGRLPERASHASGTLVNLLLEQDDAVLNPLLNSINTQLSKAWSLVLRIVQDNYVAERLLRYTGDDGMPSIIKFKGSDLRGNTDVKVTSQTGLPRGRAMKVEYLMRLRGEGLLTDDKSTLEMMEMGNVEKIFKDELLHERRAYRINAMIEENQNIIPDEILGNEEQGVEGVLYDGDDDEVHLKICNRLRLSSAYERFTPNQKATLNALIQVRQNRLQQAMQSSEMSQLMLAAKMEAVKRGATIDEQGNVVWPEDREIGFPVKSGQSSPSEEATT